MVSSLSLQSRNRTVTPCHAAAATKMKTSLESFSFLIGLPHSAVFFFFFSNAPERSFRGKLPQIADFHFLADAAHDTFCAERTLSHCRLTTSCPRRFLSCEGPLSVATFPRIDFSHSDVTPTQNSNSVNVWEQDNKQTETFAPPITSILLLFLHPI